jgi:hypothetical protein
MFYVCALYRHLFAHQIRVNKGLSSGSQDHLCNNSLVLCKLLRYSFIFTRQSLRWNHTVPSPQYGTVLWKSRAQQMLKCSNTLRLRSEIWNKWSCPHTHSVARSLLSAGGGLISIQYYSVKSLIRESTVGDAQPVKLQECHCQDIKILYLYEIR